MKPRNIFIPITNSLGTQYPISVPLPLDQAAKAVVRAHVEDATSGFGLLWREDSVADFFRRCAYLPETAAQLERADALYKTGLDWHSACQRAKEENPTPDVMVRFECGMEGRVSKAYGPFSFVQMTYEYLRVGPDGDNFAVYDQETSMWIPYVENPNVNEVRQLGAWTETSLKPDDGQRVSYSDVIIYSREAA